MPCRGVALKRCYDSQCPDRTGRSPARTDMWLLFAAPDLQTTVRVYPGSDPVLCHRGVGLRKRLAPRYLATEITLSTLSSRL